MKRTSLMSRKEAAEKGLPRYFTGKLCKRGHLAERYVSTKACCECQLLHDKIYYFNNADLRKTTAKLSKKKHAESVRACQNERYARKKSAEVFVTDEERLKIKEVYKLASAWGGKYWHVDHIVPLSKGGLHVLDNLQIIPACVNLRKYNRIIAG